MAPTNQLSDSIARIDTESNQVAGFIPVGFGPNDIAIGEVQLEAPATPISGDQIDDGSVRSADDGCAIAEDSGSRISFWWIMALGLMTLRHAAFWYRLRRISE